MKVEVWKDSKFSHFEEVPDGLTPEEKADSSYAENPLVDLILDAVLETMDAKGVGFGKADKADVVKRFKDKIVERVK